MKMLQLINGVQRMVETGDAVMLTSPDQTRWSLQVDNSGVLSTVSGTIYTESIIVGASGITTGTPITLPNGGTYLGEELQVKLNGVVVDVGDEYDYEGTGVKTQIHFKFDLIENDVIDFTKIV
jgi:hypothetical protein